MEGPKQIQYDEWLKTGEKLFGPDQKKWRFKCVNCGYAQSAEDFLKLEKPNRPEEIHKVLGFSCIGRWMPESKGTMGNRKQPCNWTLGGLFKLHKLEVIQPDGKAVPCFEFAEVR